MQAKISAGNDCLRFPRVTGGNLSAPAGNSHEVFIVRVSRPGGFFQTSGRFFLSSSKHFDQNTHLLPLKSMVNPSNMNFFQKKAGLFLAGSSNRYPKKQLAEKVFTTIKMIGNWLLSLFWFSHSY